MEHEPKEREPDGKTLMKIDLIRHGKPFYTKGELEKYDFEGKLTQEGHEQVRLKAVNLLPDIDREKEIVVIWASPKQRARESAEDLRAILEENGVSVLRENKRESLRDVRFTKEFGDELSNNGAWGDWLNYWLNKQELPIGTEAPGDVEKRMNRIFTYLSRVVKGIKLPQDKIFHFLLVGHEELFPYIVNKVCNLNEGSPKYGETMKINMKRRDDSEAFQFEFDYRGIKSSYAFNYKDRRFES